MRNLVAATILLLTFVQPSAAGRIRCSDLSTPQEVIIAYSAGATYLDHDKDGYACENTLNVYVLGKRASANAQYEIGKIYESGKEVKRNYEQAAQWYRKAAEQGLEEAQSSLASLYNHPKLLNNKQKAIYWYRKSAEQGNSFSQMFLASTFYGGDGVPKNYKESVKWYRKRAEQGQGEISYKIAKMYDYGGEGILKDTNEATKWYKKAAKKFATEEDEESNFRLACMYALGEGVSQDFAQAIKWMREAYKYDKEASGVHYEHAVVWLSKIAAQGNAEAQYYLGDIAYERNADLQDFTDAANWFRKAAEQGEAQSQYQLGWMYFLGLGVPKDDEEASKLFNASMDNGVKNSTYEELAKIFRKEAEQGGTTGQFLLGRMYEVGQVVPQDFVEGYKWYALSAAQERKNASMKLNELEKTLTTEQITEAKRRAAVFKPIEM